MPSVKKLPQHVAIVMDGNGRWAQKRHLPRLAGHKRGVDALKTTIQACAERGIPILTVFAFSSENWSRPKSEVSGLIELMYSALRSELGSLGERGMRLRFLGSRHGLEPGLCTVLRDAEHATEANQGLLLNVCFNYGGRWDIVDAAARLAAAGTPITEASMNAALSLAPCPDPDLLIRTGDEHRFSNFCFGSARTPSCISARCCGRTLTRGRWTKRSKTTPAASGVLAGPAP